MVFIANLHIFFKPTPSDHVFFILGNHTAHDLTDFYYFCPMISQESQNTTPLLGMTPDQLRDVAAEVGLKPFHARQMARWLYQARATDIDMKIGRASCRERV